LRDRAGLWACWAAGGLICLVTAAIVIYMLVRGLQYVRPDLIFSHPLAEIDQSRSGGFLDPLIGTFFLTVLGTVIAFPLGVAVAVWLSEYARPFWLARAVESCVEVIAGTPSIVLAIFGLILFSQGIFGPLSFTAEGGAVFGRSFFTAGAMMSLIALPLIVGATRESLQAVPRHVREAS
jgi:phosphate transport system permease protein